MAAEPAPSWRRPLASLLLLATLSSAGWALENGLARTPPMGWLAWTRFTCQVDCDRYPTNCINALLFRQMADRMADDGWLRAGYDYVHIDDCWSEMERDANEQLVANKSRFAAGIKVLADYVHRYDGLKLGIYGDCGTKTCAGYPAQLRYADAAKTLRPAYKAGESFAIDAPNDQSAVDVDYIRNTSTYFNIDARTLAQWQVDSLKFDGCYVDPFRAETICSKMAGALQATGRPILLICEWPFYMMYAHTEPDFELTASACNVWRYYDDIDDSWLSVLNTIDYTVKHQTTFLKYHGPGHWFDPDQLAIGNFGLSVAQSRAQMAIWCVWAAPLYMSNDLRNIRREHVEILQNPKLIGVNQDKLGVLGQMVASADQNQLQAFIKPVLPIRNGCPSFAVVFLNRKTMGNRQHVAFDLAELLARAPIRQAAANLEQVRAFEASQTGSDGQGSSRLGVLYGQETGKGQTDGTAEEDTIDADACIKRLKEAARGEGDAIEFDVEDLMDGEQLASVAANGVLDLLVGLNDVRAVKLIERA